MTIQTPRTLAATALLGLILATAAPAQADPARRLTDLQGHRARPAPVLTAPSGRAAATSATPAPAAGSPQALHGAPSDQWAPLGPFGGDVTDVLAHPSTPGLLYATVSSSSSASKGGLFRSTDDGASWTDLADPGMGGVAGLCFARDGKLWAATFNSPWVSADDGLTWTQKSLGIGVNDQVNAIACDPNSGPVLYAGVADPLGTGATVVMKTLNGGASWSALSVGQITGYSCTAVAVHPSDSARVYAGFAGSFGIGSQVFVSIDGGASFVNRSAGLPGNFGPLNALLPTGSDLYAGGGQLFGGQNFGLWHSANDGLTWSQLSLGWSNLACNDVAASGSTLLAGTSGTGVQRSTDAGASWTEAYGGTGGLTVRSVDFHPTAPPGLLAGTDGGGPYLAPDGLSFVQAATGISFLDIWGVATDPTDPDRLAAAHQSLNSGGVMRSFDGGASWSPAPNLPGERFNSVMYDSIGRLFALADGPTTIGTEGVWRSPDNGDTWVSLGPDLGPVFETELFGIDISGAAPDHIVIGGSNFGVAGHAAKIYRSLDGGASWTSTFTGLDFHDIQVVSFDDAGGSVDVVAAMSDSSGANTGAALLSGDGGLTWTPGSFGALTTLQVYDVEHDPVLPGRVWCTQRLSTGGGLFRSDDGGATWTLALPMVFATQLAASPVRAGGVALAGFQAGSLVRTQDFGATSEPWATAINPSTLFTRQLHIDVDTGPRALLATDRGVWHRTADALAGNGTVGLGLPIDLWFAGRPGLTYALFLGVTPGSSTVGAFGTLLLGAPWILVPIAPLPSGGLLGLTGTIPNDPILSGVDVLLQGLAYDPALLPVKLGAFSNLETLAIP